jgi:hypothetical protein
MARANDAVKMKLAKSSDPVLRNLKHFDSVDAAASDALDHPKR